MHSDIENLFLVLILNKLFQDFHFVLDLFGAVLCHLDDLRAILQVVSRVLLNIFIHSHFFGCCHATELILAIHICIWLLLAGVLEGGILILVCALLKTRLLGISQFLVKRIRVLLPELILRGSLRVLF